jgi:uncharacterized protein YcaQ
VHESLSLKQARRIALAAQGLEKIRPAGPVTARAVGRIFARLQLVQIDSVNVLSRSHYLPFFSRLGAYDRTILQRMAGTHPRRMMEYWAHEAGLEVERREKGPRTPLRGRPRLRRVPHGILRTPLHPDRQGPAVAGRAG